MGHVEIHEDLPSFAEGFSRTVRIFTPARYDLDREARFGVIYMQDGQNVFEHPRSARSPGWAADTTLEALIESGRVGPWMIVAIDHGLGRFEEYSPWDEPRENVKARGDQYARFLLEQLKPWVDYHYRTCTGPEQTAVVGSSLGGLISLYLHRWHTDVFGRAAALSPSVMWSGHGLFRHWSEHARSWTRLYIDAGSDEHFGMGAFPMNYGEETRRFGEHLVQLGYAPHELRVELEPGGLHTEADWRRRLPSAFEWLLAPL
jgi:predicted alpha/beta superfamily hydrolase